MVNVEKFEAFPTCIYRFKHEFEKNERQNIIDLIITESIVEKNNKKVQRLGSQLDDHLHKKPLFKKLSDAILEASHDLMEEHEYEYDSLEITNMWGNILKPNSLKSSHGGTDRPRPTARGPQRARDCTGTIDGIETRRFHFVSS